MGNIFYTSDQHWGHPHVAALRGFDDVQSHDDWMIERWTRFIGPKDTVFVLGDIAVQNPQRALAIIGNLPGEKHLVAGNHDAAHPMHYRKFNRAFKDFSEVFATIAPMRQRKINGFPVMLSHFPFEAWGDGWERQGSRHNEWRLPDMGRPLLHGHTHGTERAHDNMFHVGIDAWAQPVPEAWVTEWLNVFHGPPEIRSDKMRLPVQFSTTPLCADCDQAVTLAGSEVKGKQILCLDCFGK